LALIYRVPSRFTIDRRLCQEDVLQPPRSPGCKLFMSNYMGYNLDKCV
jgi:hypothetical protein